MQSKDIFAIQIAPKKGYCKIGSLEGPMTGFGTYRLQGLEGKEAILQAMQCGYLIFDTATYYENFDAMKGALKHQDRQQFYLISKVWHDQQKPEDLYHDFKKTLKELDIEYLDAYLIHWPNSTIPLEQTLGAMEKLRQEKKIHHIGLCNITVNHLKKVLKVGVPITWVQVEMHPGFYDKTLLDFCSQHGISMQAWRPLNLGNIYEDKMLIEVGKKYGKTAAQVALRWITQHGVIPIPSSKNLQHIQENLNITDFFLEDQEMERINSQAIQGQRFRLTLEHGLGFSDEFDFSYEECWPNS